MPFGTWRTGSKESGEIKVGVLKGHPALITNWGGRQYGVMLTLDGAGNVQGDEFVKNMNVKGSAVFDSGGSVLRVKSDGISIKESGIEVANFGSTVTIGEVGASKSNVYITSGAIQLRNNTTAKITLSNSGAISTVGNVEFAGKLVVNDTLGGTDYNVCVGTNNSEGGFYNVAVGYLAGQDMLTGGNYNTCVGAGAGMEVTDGDKNLMLGYLSGTTSSPSGEITTETGIVCLGNDDITSLCCKDDSITTSDERDKADIEDLIVGLDFVNKMRPITYKWDMRSYYWEDKDSDNPIKHDRDGSKKETEIHVGLIAQEVQKIEQEYGYSQIKDDGNVDQDTELVVNTTEDYQRMGIQYGKLAPIIIKAVQELSAKVDKMDERITNLEAV